MKTKFITAAGVLMALWLIPPTNAIAKVIDDLVIACSDHSACVSEARLGCKEYCCPTGATGTTYTCPAGWTHHILTGLCERSSTSGSDSTGSYTTEYTSCDPTTTTYDCYTPSTSSTITRNGSTYRCLGVALPTTCD